MRPRFPRHFDLDDVESYLESHRTHEWVLVESVRQLWFRRPNEPPIVRCHHPSKAHERQDRQATHECARCGLLASKEAPTWDGVPDCDFVLTHAVLET